jgi:hypothetical protein
MDLRPLLIAGLAAGVLMLGDFNAAPILGLGPAVAFAKSGNTGSGSGLAGAKRVRATGTGDIAPSAHGGAPSGASSEAARSPLDDLPDGEFGALPAVTADLQAFLHANPRSEVGRIAIYARALITLESASSSLTVANQAMVAARMALADANATKDKALHNLRLSYPDLDNEKVQDTLNELDNLLQDGNGDSRTRDEVAAINNLVAAEAALATAQVGLSNARAILAEARSSTTAAARAAGDALAAAAGKVSADPGFKSYVDNTLQWSGILDYYRSRVTTSSAR